MEDLLQLKKIEAQVLKKLLEDKTTGKNIIWATDSYENLGPGYERNQQIRVDHLQQKDIIRPRIQKDLEVQKDRTKKNAEVHTPAWIVNQMNNQVDLDWLNNDSGFNQEIETSWIHSEQKINFKSHSEKWKAYVKRKVLEITCGEVPFLTSRYDCSNGQKIDVKDRIGLLDRKLRIITENTNSIDEWINYAFAALKSVYGYEIQGDSLLIGRLNLYLSFLETVQQVWEIDLSIKDKIKIADIISWNILQMDGLTYKTPDSISSGFEDQLTLFNFNLIEENRKTKKSYEIQINFWGSSGKTLFSRLKGNGKMKKKFDVIIGNPPYQESDGGNNASAIPTYQKFITEAEKLNPTNMCLIIPDRWFSGGRGLDAFREKMKNDDHIKYLYDFQNASDCFPGVDISGGICYFIRNKDYSGPCRFVNHGKTPISSTRYLNEFPVIVRSNDAVSILEKVNSKGLPSLSAKVSSQKPFGLRTYVKPDKEGELVLRWNKGKGPIKRENVTAGKEMIDKTKVIVSRVFFEHAGQANKDGTYRVLSVLETMKPGEVCTETYVVIDSFDQKEEAENLLKFLKTKFARYLILQAASSIMITKTSFIFVPQLDFGSTSNIDWSKSISEIDKQIADYFGLSKTESEIINKTIREME